ncbi:transcriptional regulator, partial [Salmonella enterica subsp. enterica serovar Typhimurium]|uniref:DNA/RNA nuclease SfsA n=1 Tax=Salmonella enterica TaxID=28901 RepID=UPI0007A81337
WEKTHTQSGRYISVQPLRANKQPEAAHQENRLPAQAGYKILKREVKYGAERSRIDIKIQTDFRPDCNIEVKSDTIA